MDGAPDQFLGTRTTALSSDGATNVQQSRIASASGVWRRDGIGEGWEAGFVLGGGRMRRRELDYRATWCISFYFVDPSRHICWVARKSVKNILGWRERGWSTDQKIWRVSF